MAVLARRLSVWPIFVAAVAVPGAGCGGDGEPAPSAESDTLAAVPIEPGADTIAGPAPAPVALSPVPPDFPVPPMSTVTSAEADSAADGTFTNVTIRSEGDPESGYAWYREALTRAGWTITAETGGDGPRSLHAELGESYVDLTVVEDPPGRTRADAAIWMIHP